MRGKFRLILFSAILLTMMAVYSCSEGPDNYISGSGNFEATETRVSSKMNGQILELKVDEGEYVSKEDTIAIIDTEKLIIQRKRAEAGFEELNLARLTAREMVKQASEKYNNLKKQYERIRNLYEKHSATEKQLEDVETQLRVAESQLKSANLNISTLDAKRVQLEAEIELLNSSIDDGIIRSPIPGVVLEKYVNVGEIVTMGQPLVKVGDLQNMWIRVYIVESDLGRVKLNSPAVIKIDSYPDREFNGRVVWISSKAEFTPKNVETKEARVDLVYAVKVAVPNPEGIFKIGMPSDVIIKQGK
ncbi:MAG: HlyD family secretion protein [Fidelibacterota bacterium]